MTERLVDLAKTFLRSYFADGVERQPATMEDDIFGGPNFGLLVVGESQWRRSPFCPAMGELMAEGYLEAWEDGEGWHYQKRSVHKQEAHS